MKVVFMRSKIAFLLAFLMLLGYLISENSASFYMLKGFTNALYLNVSPQSFTLTYPINSIATTTINVYATYVPYSYFGNAIYENYIMFSGINGSTFLGNLSFIPYQNGILIPKTTLLGNTYKTLALYYNGSKAGFTGYYSKTYTDTLQNNYEFVYYSFYNYNLITTQAQTIPAQPNNNTNTGGTFQISFDNLPIPYFLITAPTSYLNLTYYRGTGIVARQIQAVYSNSNALLIGNGNVYKQNVVDNGLLLNPSGNIWLGYLNMPLYYYNYNITNASTINSVPIGLYYSNYNYILNILMPNTQKVYSHPNYFYSLIPAFNTANIITSNTTQVITLPKFEYQFNITNINWTMRPSDWLNWSGGYTLHNFTPQNTAQNPSFSTSYLMFSLPAYPCLQSSNGQYGNIQVFGMQGTTNLGQIPIAQWNVQNNRVYYIMPSKTSKGLTYTQALAYICTAKPIQSQLNTTLASQFVIAKYTGSGKASATNSTLGSGDANFIAFINPTLFYGNETLHSYWYYSSQYGSIWLNTYIYAQQISYSEFYEGSSAGGSFKQLANNKIYIFSMGEPNTWSNNEAFTSQYKSGNQYIFSLFNSTKNNTSWVAWGNYQYTTFALPYNATATLVNYFTTKYVLGNLTGIATTSSSNSSSVSNPVITPASPKLNLSITNSTIATNLANLKTTLNKSVVLYGITLPIGTIYIVLLLVIVALAVLSKSEGALIIALIVLWLTGLFFIPELIIAGIITLAYMTYRLEGLFKNRG